MPSIRPPLNSVLTSNFFLAKSQSARYLFSPQRHGNDCFSRKGAKSTIFIFTTKTRKRLFFSQSRKEHNIYFHHKDMKTNDFLAEAQRAQCFFSQQKHGNECFSRKGVKSTMCFFTTKTRKRMFFSQSRKVHDIYFHHKDMNMNDFLAETRRALRVLVLVF